MNPESGEAAIKKRGIILVAFGAVLSVLIMRYVWALSLEPSLVASASEAWSRGRVVGITPVKRRVALDVAAEEVFLAWANEDNGIELACIDRAGQVVYSRVLSLGAERARDPQLRAGAGGRLHLAWREGSGAQAAIRYAVLDLDGAVVEEPRPLSRAGSAPTGRPEMVLDGAGRLHLMWSDAEGVEWTTLDTAGAVLREPVLLIPAGELPSLRVDERGELHVAWRQQARSLVWTLHYAAVDAEGGVLGRPLELMQVFLRHGQSLEGPVLGLTAGEGHAFWTVQDVVYVYDPALGGQARFSLADVTVAEIGDFRLRRGEAPLGLYPLEGAREPLLVALSVMVPGAEGVRTQIAVVGVGEGRAAEEIVTASLPASSNPMLVMDAAGNMHMAWLESAGFRQYQVVYASTAAEVVAVHSQLTWSEVVDRGLDAIFQYSTLILSLAVFLCLWGGVPLVGLVIYHFATSQETLERVAARVVLAVALVGEVVLTLLVPFSHPSIGASGPVAAWGVPLLSAGLTTGLTIYVMRRRGEFHLFGAFFLFTLVNVFLQGGLFLIF